MGAWLDYGKISWWPLEFSRQYITQPLGICEDFGFIGVSLIFLTSGFLITHSGQKENRKEFSVKRLLRIYPALIVSIIIILGVYFVYSIITQAPTYFSSFSPQDIILSMSLLNYIVTPVNAVNGVAWILLVQGIFYLACFLLLPFLNKKPLKSIAILLAFCVLTTALASEFGQNFLLFAISASYIPYIVLGQVFYYFWERRITKVQFAVFSITTFFVSISGMSTLRPDFLEPYTISFLYAYIIFVAALLLTKRIQPGRILGFFSKISYSFYLNNTVSNLFLVILFPIVGYEISLGVAFALLTSIAYLSWRFVEQPSKKIIRAILKNTN